MNESFHARFHSGVEEVHELKCIMSMVKVGVEEFHESIPIGEKDFTLGSSYASYFL